MKTESFEIEGKKVVQSMTLPSVSLIIFKVGSSLNNSILFVILQAMDIFDVAEGYGSLQEGLARVECPVMVIGVQTDILFPIIQQREMASTLEASGIYSGMG